MGSLTDLLVGRRTLVPGFVSGLRTLLVVLPGVVTGLRIPVVLLPGPSTGLRIPVELLLLRVLWPGNLTV
jgi:hypothetical protein